MTNKKVKTAKPKSKNKAPAKTAAVHRPTKSEAMIALMRREGGASAAELAQAAGWRVHSVRGFISGTLKKKGAIEVATISGEGGARYVITDRKRRP